MVRNKYTYAILYGKFENEKKKDKKNFELPLEGIPSPDF